MCIRDRYQTNAVLSNAVPPETLTRNKIGVSQSDTVLFGNEQATLAVADQVPVMINGDTRFARLEVLARWPNPAPANPFGFEGGEQRIANPQHLAWVSASRGLAPLNAFVLRMDQNTVQNRENFVEALRMFGEGGSQVGQFGVLPQR